MRSFQQVVLFLFALLVCAFAQESEDYETTVYLTSTVYRVNTVTMSTSAPAIPAANTTSTISAVHAAAQPTIAPSYAAGNATVAMLPSGSGTTGSQVQPSKPATFEGVASSLNVNAFVVALAAGLGYLVI
jgi:hypothetical protein